MAGVIKRLRRDERGMSLVFVGLGFMGFLAASTLAIDVGMLMTARSQAQNAADAAAHAGAVALAFDDFTNRSAGGPAVQSALAAGTDAANGVMNGPVSMNASDVTFPNDPSGNPNWIRATVYRSGGRSNPVSTLMASFFGVATADITATATAEATQANAVTCVKPLAIPDRWIERQTPGWDTGDTFSVPANPSVQPDIYRTAGSGSYTGYSSVTDRGLQLTLTIVTLNTIRPNMYFAVNLGGGYTDAIESCDDGTMHFGDALVGDAAATAGNTASAMSDLISQDPGAYWDSSSGRVVSSQRPSPRVIVVPVYDPAYFEAGRRIGIFTQLRVANYIGLFVDSVAGNNVQVRITPVGGMIDRTTSAAPSGAFPKAIRLVE